MNENSFPSNILCSIIVYKQIIASPPPPKQLGLGHVFGYLAQGHVGRHLEHHPCFAGIGLEPRTLSFSTSSPRLTVDLIHLEKPLQLGGVRAFSGLCWFPGRCCYWLLLVVGAVRCEQ